MSQAIFIDRDGTIGGSDQVVLPGEFQFFPYAKQVLEELKQAGKLVFAFTNQPVISEGKVTREDYERELKQFGFDSVYLCPHHHVEGCPCRKPSPEMLHQAAREYHLRLNECAVIGDRWTDMLAAHEAGCIKVLVKTGAGEGVYHKYQNQAFFGKWAEVSPDFVADNIKEAVNWLLSKQN